MASFVLRPLTLSITLAAFATSPVLGQLPVPTSGTTEWNFTGATGGAIDKAYGPGELEYADGPGGMTSMVDMLTTTSAAGIPDIGGTDSPVMYFGLHDPNTLGYFIRPLTGAANNDLFDFTLVFDLYLEPNNNDPWGGLLNGNASNSNDSELFLQPSTQTFYSASNGGGLGAGSYTLGSWFRVVYAVQYQNAILECYVDGQLAFTGTPFDYIYDGQSQSSWVLCDNNGEVTTGYIANLAVTDAVLNASDAQALGAPRPNGIFETTIGTNYCTAAANSTGSIATMSASGSASVSANALVLSASNLPSNQFGIFVTSRMQAFIMGAGGTSNGNLCVGGQIGRFSDPSQILTSGALGTFSLGVDLTQLPQGSGFTSAMAGETWNFQGWYRDGVGLGSNFTDGLQVDMQ